MTDRTRYQILCEKHQAYKNRVHNDQIYNFAARQHTAVRARCAALKQAGVKFTVWDTRQNELSKLIQF